MIVAVKKAIFNIFGPKKYLSILHSVFRLAYTLGFLKNNEEYKYHYFVKQLIRPDDTVVDIGANLGYFSTVFARLTKPNGKLISFEPVPIFYEVLERSLKNFSHCTVYNAALGEENKKITMSIPNNQGYLRTGLASVSNKTKEEAGKDFVFESNMMIGSVILNQLDRLDYIKCDIEGYEEYVLVELKGVIARFRPMLQVETWAEHKTVVLALMEELNYQRYNLVDGRLQKGLSVEEDYGDYLFVPTEKEADLLARLS